MILTMPISQTIVYDCNMYNSLVNKWLTFVSDMQFILLLF